MKLIKQGYTGELTKQSHTDDGAEVELFPARKGGRKVLLGKDLDRNVQVYLKKPRGWGTISMGIAMAAARGILQKSHHSLRAEYGGPIHLTLHWAHSLLKRMKLVQRKATTSNSKYRGEHV